MRRRRRLRRRARRRLRPLLPLPRLHRQRHPRAEPADLDAARRARDDVGDRLLGVSTGIDLGPAARQRSTCRCGSPRPAGIALPNFVIASFLVIVLVFVIPLLPVAGWGTMRHMLLPGFCLGLVFAAYIARLTRTGMLETLSADFIRTAHAKGLAPRTVVHAPRAEGRDPAGGLVPRPGDGGHPDREPRHRAHLLHPGHGLALHQRRHEPRLHARDGRHDPLHGARVRLNTVVDLATRCSIRASTWRTSDGPKIASRAAEVRRRQPRRARARVAAVQGREPVERRLAAAAAQPHRVPPSVFLALFGASFVAPLLPAAVAGSKDLSAARRAACPVAVGRARPRRTTRTRPNDHRPGRLPMQGLISKPILFNVGWRHQDLLLDRHRRTRAPRTASSSP